MSKASQIQLADVVLDISVRHREPEPFTVNSYRQAFRVGAKFPPLIIERGTNRLVCGWHRFEMYRKELEPSSSVDCLYETFASDLELWERAVSDNVNHGRPLDTWDKKRILLKMQELGADKARIALVLGVTPEKLDEWNGMLVVVTSQRNGVAYEEEKPVKHGQEHLIGQRIDEGEYERHVRCETGVNARRLAFALKRLVARGWIDKTDERAMGELQLLYDVLGEFLRAQAA